MIRITRRAFLTASLGAAARLSAFNSTAVRFAAIAGTHTIDDFYKGPEGNTSDSRRVWKPYARPYRQFGYHDYAVLQVSR
jgi:hypothetical protein